MSTENYILALGGNVYIWCMGAVLGWLLIPIMNSNMDSLLRELIPIDMQGRVYSARNTFQFFTIPVGYMLGGLLVDNVFEPFMCNRTGLLQTLFGSGKGSGAALLFMLMGFAGTLICLIFRHDKYIY